MRWIVVFVLALAGCNLFSPVGETSRAARDVAGGDVEDLGTDVSRDVFETGVDAAPDAANDVGFPPPFHEAELAYDFETPGDTAADVSDGTGYDLTVVGAAELVDGAAVIDGSGALQTREPPTEFYDAVSASREFAIAGWVESANIEQGDPDDAADNRRVVTLSMNSAERNVTLAQWRGNAVLRVRSTQTSDNGTPQTVVGGAFAVRRQHHLLQLRGSRLEYYVDGELAHRSDIGALESWDPSFRLRLGDEFEDSRQWQGTLYDVRLYASSFSSNEARQLFAAGVP